MKNNNLVFGSLDAACTNENSCPLPSIDSVSGSLKFNNLKKESNEKREPNELFVQLLH
jgi:hypothetical protein